MECRCGLFVGFRQSVRFSWYVSGGLALGSYLPKMARQASTHPLALSSLKSPLQVRAVTTPINGLVARSICTYTSSPTALLPPLPLLPSLPPQKACRYAKGGVTIRRNRANVGGMVVKEGRNCGPHSLLPRPIASPTWRILRIPAHVAHLASLKVLDTSLWL